jgi:hypothetical protein
VIIAEFKEISYKTMLLIMCKWKTIEIENEE